MHSMSGVYFWWTKITIVNTHYICLNDDAEVQNIMNLIFELVFFFQCQMKFENKKKHMPYIQISNKQNLSKFHPARILLICYQLVSRRQADHHMGVIMERKVDGESAVGFLLFGFFLFFAICDRCSVSVTSRNCVASYCL